MDQTFEDILEQIGSFGKYQKYSTFLFLPVATAVLGIVNINTLFMVSVPEHWCHVDVVASSNLTTEQQRALVSPTDDPKCSMFDVNYTEILWSGHNANDTTPVVPCRGGWDYDRTEYDTTVTTKWNLVCDKRFLPSIILTIQNVGSLVLTPFYGYLGDRCGRKRMYLVLVALVGAVDLLSVLPNHFVLFAVLRFFQGSTEPTMYATTFILLVEIVAPERRADVNGVANACWTLGFCILPLLAYLSRNWVNLGIISASLSLVAIAVSRFVPESPSWLISRGRYKEATAIMEKIARTNGKTVNSEHIFKQLQTLGMNCQKQKDVPKSGSVFDLFKFPRIRKHFFILSFCWSGFNLIYFGFMYNLRNLSGNEFLIFFLLSAVEMPGNFLAWFLLDRAGRRWTSSIGFIILAFICFGPLTGVRYSDITCSMAGKLVITGLFMTTDQQGTELFPTAVRSFAINLAKTLAGTAGLLSPFFADLGEENKNLPFLIMALVSIISGFLASFLPESLNESLPQTLQEAEELGKDQKFFSWRRYRNPISLRASSFAELGTQEMANTKKSVLGKFVDEDGKSDYADGSKNEDEVQPMITDQELNKLPAD